MSYLFVDGAYLISSMREWGTTWFNEPAVFEPAKLSESYEKTFYYDAMPVQKDGETDGDFDKRKGQQLAFFKYLASHSGWHVFYGESKRRGRGEKKRVDQKEVDVLIAVDMLNHTYRKNTDRMGFVAGDLDFRPLVEAVVREGMFIRLISDPRHASEELIQAADHNLTLDFWAMHNICNFKYRERHPVPSRGYHSDRPALNQHAMREHGRERSTGRVVAAFWEAQGSGRPFAISSLVPTNDSGHFALYEMMDEALLKKVYQFFHGDIEWLRGPPPG